MNGRVSTQQKSDLRRAAVRARGAPSVHNTQPWRFHLSPGELSIYADRSRQLTVLDPTARSLTISCGCALMNARVSLAASGAGVEVQRFPDPGEPDLFARLVSSEIGEDNTDRLAALDPVLELRQTNRREFVDNDVPEALIETLEDAAAREGSTLFVIRTDDQRLTVATLSQQADAIENVSPAYRAELRAWTTDDSARMDGVPGIAVPHVDAGAEDEVPIRDFDARGTGGLPVRTHSSRNQCLILLCTNGDGPMDWLRAGEALERVLLEITRHGYVASPLTQVTEVPSSRVHLRQELGLIGYPHVLLRIGRAPLTPGSRRRRLVDVLIED
jgi:hypothetical protein